MARLINLGGTNIVPHGKTILLVAFPGATKRCLPSYKVHEVEKNKPKRKKSKASLK